MYFKIYNFIKQHFSILVSFITIAFLLNFKRDGEDYAGSV